MWTDSASSVSGLIVVGGSYRERCHFPNWSQYFGSGLRASCAISKRNVAIKLKTYVSAADRRMAETIAATLGVELDAIESPGSFDFEYLHSLAQPILNHTSDAAYDLPPLEVEAERVLAFGMLEGNPIIRGDRVVFDPQSPYEAASFHQNGSTAEHLALVANAAEAKVLAQQDDLEAAGRKLLESAEVVVVKNGVQGAHVFTNGRMERIPAFQTRDVFLVGSGDVFSASFAYAWLQEGLDPFSAAELASRATAFYCQTTVLPIPASLPSTFQPREIVPNTSPLIYLAGPFFAPHQLRAIEEARAHLLQQGARVFSPYHDVGLGAATFVASADLEALRTCDAVFAFLTDYDPGTVFEVGYARALGKRVVALLGSAHPKNTTMFIGSGCEVFDDYVSAIYNAVWV